MYDPLTNAFESQQVAELYDTAEGARPDLEAYAAIVAEFGATSVVDLGCGTGVLACRLTDDGVHAIGVEPAAAMLDVARRRTGSERVEWIHGDADAIPTACSEMVLMTGNVAQVFVTDAEWDACLTACRRGLQSGGRLVFETRIPERRAWERWTREHTYSTFDTGAGRVETWADLLHVGDGLVSFRWTTVYPDSTRSIAESKLRFREFAELERSLADAGFMIDEVRDAPDRPGLEWVVVARARETS